jgi:hypothetical protein
MHDPRVELRCIAEPVFFIGALPRHKPVERHSDVGDHVRHCSLLSATVGNADRHTASDSSRPSKRVSRNEVIHGSAVLHRPNGSSVRSAHAAWVPWRRGRATGGPGVR